MHRRKLKLAEGFLARVVIIGVFALGLVNFSNFLLGDNLFGIFGFAFSFFALALSSRTYRREKYENWKRDAEKIAASVWDEPLIK